MDRGHAVPLLVEETKGGQDSHKARSKRHLAAPSARRAPGGKTPALTVPVATAVVCSTTFSWGVMGLRRRRERRKPMSADWSDILADRGVSARVAGRVSRRD